MGKVLTGNGITSYERGTYDLVGGEELCDAERDQLLQLCRQRLDAFREQQKGMATNLIYRGTRWITTSQPSASA